MSASGAAPDGPRWAEVAQRFGLTPSGGEDRREPSGGAGGAASPRRGERLPRILHATDGDGRAVTVKIERDAAALDAAVRALRHWDGRGAVRVVDVDAGIGAVVLERALPGTPLGASALPDADGAAVAAGVIRELHAADSSPPALPHLRGWLSRLGRRRRALGEDLLRRSGRDVVLHGDLHHDNILRHGPAGWLAVDPKGVLGPREAEPAAFLRNPRDELLEHPDPVGLLAARVRVFARSLDHDPALVLDWGQLLCEVAATWALGDGEGREEVERWRTCGAMIGATRAGG